MSVRGRNGPCHAYRPDTTPSRFARMRSSRLIAIVVAAIRRDALESMAIECTIEVAVDALPIAKIANATRDSMSDEPRISCITADCVFAYSRTAGQKPAGACGA